MKKIWNKLVAWFKKMPEVDPELEELLSAFPQKSEEPKDVWKKWNSGGKVKKS